MIPFAQRFAVDTIKQPKSIQSITGTSSGGTGASTLAVTFANPNTGGNLLLAWITFDNSGTPSVTGIADTAGNVWKFIFSNVQANDGQRNELWYCENCRVCPSNIVTLTKSGASNFTNMALVEVTGIAKTNSLDKTANTQANVAAPNSGSVFPTNFNEYCLGSFYGGSSLAAATGWTILQNSDISVQLMEQVISSPFSIAATSATATNNIAGISTFRAAGQGAV